MKHATTLATLLLALAAAVMPAARAQSPTGDRNSVRIEFDSYTPATMYDLARERRQNWAPQRVWGDLTFPPVKASPVPAMVITPVVTMSTGRGK